MSYQNFGVTASNFNLFEKEAEKVGEGYFAFPLNQPSQPFPADPSWWSPSFPTASAAKPRGVLVSNYISVAKKKQSQYICKPLQITKKKKELVGEQCLNIGPYFLIGQFLLYSTALQVSLWFLILSLLPEEND